MMATLRLRKLIVLRLLRVGALLGIPLWLATAAAAADLFVGTGPTDFPTIQDAIDAASPGDRIFVRAGVYTEDITVNKPRIEITPVAGEDVLLDGDITVTIDAADAFIHNLPMAEGHRVLYEDGIEWPATLPDDGDNRVVAFGGTASSPHDIVLGDVTASVGIDFPDITGVSLSDLGSGSTVTQTGTVNVQPSSPGLGSATASGVVISASDTVDVELDSIQVQARSRAVGGQFVAGADNRISVTGTVSVYATAEDSQALGIRLQGDEGVSLAVHDVVVQAGGLAAGRVDGLEFYAGAGAALNHSGSVNVAATETGSLATGVRLSAGDGSSLVIGNVTVTGGAEAFGVTTIPSVIVPVAGLQNDVTLYVGDVSAIAADPNGVAYGIGLDAMNGLTLVTGNVSVEGPRWARGVGLYLRDGGSVAITGAITVKSSDGVAEGLTAIALNDFRATVGNVSVEGAGDQVRGVALDVQSHGQLTHEGIIAVTGTGAAQAHGIVVAASDSFSATLGDVLVEGSTSANGLEWNTGNSSTLSSTGVINATATDVNGTATGVTFVGGSSTNATLGAVEAVAWNFGGAARGVVLTLGDFSTFSIESIRANAAALAGGLEATLSNGASVQVGEIWADEDSGFGDGAFGARLQASSGATVTFGDVLVAAGRTAEGIKFTGGDGNTLIQTGRVGVFTTDASSTAVAADISAALNNTIALGQVEVSSFGNARGVRADIGAGSGLSIGQLSVVTDGAVAEGLYLTAGDNVAVQVGTEGAVHIIGRDQATGIQADFQNNGSLDILGDLTVDAYGAALSSAQGLRVNGQDNLRIAAGDLRAAASASAVGVYVNAGERTSATFGDVRATSGDPTSTASGIQYYVGADSDLTVANIEASAGIGAVGLYFLPMTGPGQDNLTVTHSGQILARAFAASGSARGAWGTVGDDFNGTFDEVRAHGGGNGAQGMSVTAGNRARLQVNLVEATTGDTDGYARGLVMDALDDAQLNVNTAIAGSGRRAEAVTVTALDNLTLNVGDVHVDAPQAAFGVWVTAYSSTINVEGSIAVTSDASTGEARGVRVDGGDGSVVEMTNQGVISASANHAVTVGLGQLGSLERATFRNRGVVAQSGRTGHAVGINVTADAVVENDGMILAGDGFALVASLSTGAVSVVNTGYVEGMVILGRWVDTLTNTGRMVGAVRTGDGADRITVTDSGELEGDLDTGADSDQVAVMGHGRVSGNIYTADGNDTLTVADNAVVSGHVVTGDGTDVVTVSDSGRITGDVDTGDGSDRLSLTGAGTIDGNVTLGTGDDAATLDYGTTVSGLLDGGPGNDSLTLVGPTVTELPAGPAWAPLTAVRFDNVDVQGGAWQLGAGTDLGDVQNHMGVLRVDDAVTVSRLTLGLGSLIGTGNVAGNVVNMAGFLSPGSAWDDSVHSYGIFTVTGNYTQEADGVLYVELDASSAPDPGVNYDQLVVTGGTATFADGTTIMVQPVLGPVLPARYEYVLVDGHVVFDPESITLTIPLPPRLFFDGWLEAGSLKLVLGLKPMEFAAETPNQAEVARALYDAIGAPDTDLAELYAWLTSLTPEQIDEARAAFTSLSGEVYSHLPLTALRRLDAFAAAVRRGPGVPERAPGRVWALLYHDTGMIRPGTGTAGSSLSLSGIAAGADLFRSGSARLGLAASGSLGRLAMDERASQLSAQAYMVALYGDVALDRSRLSAILAYGNARHASRRTVRFGPAERPAEADFSTTDWAAVLEARLPYAGSESFSVTPLVSLAYYQASHDGFTETGAETTGLTVHPRTMRWLRGRLGVEAIGQPSAVRLGTLTLRGRVAWVHDFVPAEPQFEAHLVGAPSAPFGIEGRRVERNALEANVGLELQTVGGWTWSLDYTGELQSGLDNHALMGRVSFPF